jgi:hypothetical protein
MHILLYSLLMGALLKASHVLSRFCSLSPADFTMLRFVLTGLIATVILLSSIIIVIAGIIVIISIVTITLVIGMVTVT